MSILKVDILKLQSFLKMIYGGQAKFLITSNLSIYLQYKSLSVSVKDDVMSPIKKELECFFFSYIFISI